MTVAVLMSPELRDRLFAPGVLAGLGEVRQLADDSQLVATLDGVVACLTGWDSPRLTDDVLDRCPALGLVAHTGGSVRPFVAESAYGRGVRISQAAGVLAEAVAEFAVLQILAGLRDAYDFAARMRAGESWESLAARPPGRLLSTAVVGLVGAGRAGRATMERLRPFGCELLVCDPYLDQPTAASYGARLVTLDELLSESDVVSLHAPLLPETRGLIGARELARLRPGALLVNTARAGLTDEAALLDAVRRGRIRVALDVFGAEPLPTDSPWRTASGVVTTPHIAALTAETLYQQGASAAAEVRRFLTGEPLHSEVSRDAFHVIA